MATDATDIYIISGFLGAGKTTFIQKLLNESFKSNKVVLIENDFGEINIDSKLLGGCGIEVKEISSGCICCNLSGDFVKAVKEITDKLRPDKIIIEPSGVGKLSDIIKALENPKIKSLINIKTKITLADAKRCKMYLNNFGEFFENQIQNADTILLSRTEEYPDKIMEAKKILTELNSKAKIISTPWNQLNTEEILFNRTSNIDKNINFNDCDDFNENFSHEHSCHHHHDADEFFRTVTLKFDEIYTGEDIKNIFHKLEHNITGSVIRAKGILQSKNNYLNIQYITDSLEITNSNIEGNSICFIGKNINEEELLNVFKTK